VSVAAAPSYLQHVRSRLGRRKLLLVYASACVRDAAGRVLWQRRSDFGWWGLPGGMLELDETLAECAVREVREESGLQVEPLRLVGVYSSPDFDVLYPNGDEAQQVTFCYECRVRGGDLRCDGDETLDLGWYAAETPPPTAPWYAAMLHDLRAGGRPAFASGAAGQAQRGEPFLEQLRRTLGPAPLIVPAAGAFVQDAEGRVLLQRRADSGFWDLPGGGMELGERLDCTAAREAREEAGVMVEVQRLLRVYSEPEFFLCFPEGESKFVLSLFACRWVGGEPRPDGRESLDAAFFARDALPPMQPLSQRMVQDGFALLGEDCAER